MTADRWQQVATVYEAVLALAPEARAEYLAAACRDDPELRQEVDSLLAHASRPVLVDGSVWDAAEGVIDIECAGDLPQGTRIGPYCVGALLGRGGMGQVYRARDMKLQRDVAVKILPERFVNDTGRVARFTLEAQILASLNHPNIGAIYGFEQSNHVHALILELIDAPTLAERIANGPLALDTALPIARQIVDALEAAHEHGIVHRDLKPANIKVKPDGTVKVLDFGLAKLQEHVRNISEPVSASPPPSEIENSPITAAGMVLGTAAYMSPEQAEAEVADKRSDIWAFGCVLYEMLTGVRAYAGKAATSVNVLRDEPDWRAVQHFPAPVQRLLRRCLQKDRKKRLADIADARLELDDAVAATPNYAHSPPVSARRRERIGWIVLAAVAAVLGWLASSPRDRVPETRLEMVTPPTIDPLSLAVSPDGESVVFAAAGEQGVTQLWLRSLPAGSSRPLPHTARAASPFWSHDGKSLGFFADRKLKRLDLATGVVTILAESGGGGGGSWNASGTILFAPRRLGPILRVAASGGTPVPVTKLASNHGGHLHPQFLPDGRRFVFYPGWRRRKSAVCCAGPLALRPPGKAVCTALRWIGCHAEWCSRVGLRSDCCRRRECSRVIGIVCRGHRLPLWHVDRNPPVRMVRPARSFDWESGRPGYWKSNQSIIVSGRAHVGYASCTGRQRGRLVARYFTRRALAFYKT
jgi:eukaryotic-like serine/threonine-protein kinase